MSAGGAHPPATLRLFFALWPSGHEQRALAGAAAAAVAGSGGRAMPAANLHVTLAFLGNVDPARLAALGAAAHGVVAAGGRAPAPLELHFTALEHWARPQILCATAGDAAPRAHALAASLRRATLAAGFSPDLKPFRAHVTVARKVARVPDEQPLPRVTWKLGEFALVASVTSAAGSLYSVLESYPLDRPGNARK